MAAFTTLTDGFTPNAHLAELITACNERRLAAIASGATGLPGAIPSTEPGVFQGDGLTKPLHLLVQEMLEALAPHFVDHGHGYLDTGFRPLPLYTLASWRSAAGLSSSGFRRATAWVDPSAAPSFEYGRIQTGDIAGYWIWEDIVKGLKALQWTDGGWSGLDDPQSIIIDGEHAQTQEDAIDLANAAWHDSSWEDVPDATSAQHSDISVLNDSVSAAYWAYSLRAYRRKPTLSLAAAAPVAATVTFVGWSERSIITWPFYDFGQTQFAENEWLDHANVALAEESTGASAGYSAMPPQSSDPFSHVVVDSPPYGRRYRIYSILKWTFTHS